jgi:hypothetical protein|tara:strand:- start:5043 stop:5222 length:180 start_codon:yes stop_codon:yes gene_type:complete
VTDALIILNLLLGASVLAFLNAFLLIKIKRERVELKQVEDVPHRDIHPIEELLYGAREG